MLRRLTAASAALALAAAVPGAQAIRVPQDAGASGAWQLLLKTRTIASAMHTTAHPDDEHGGVLAMLSRGQGVRVSLMTLNRGESGDNAIGAELFDALGLIRTEELADAGAYYGLDAQYFTDVADYGFSKRLDEALDKWGRETVLREVVRTIRLDRPLVLISRFQGNERDGHGNHQAAGVLSQEAFRAAGDPQRFPELAREGLRPWQPLKLYMGGVRPNEDWTLRVNAGQIDPVLGDSYQNFSRVGLAFQRSQNGGVAPATTGPAFQYYKRLASLVQAPDKESSFFDGIDVTLPGLYRALRKNAPAEAGDLLATIDRETLAATEAFRITDPGAAAPALARALSAARTAVTRLGGDPDVQFVLQTKERQIERALAAARGLRLEARAVPADDKGPATPFSPPPAMGPLVPGLSFIVEAQLVGATAGPGPGAAAIGLAAPNGWRIEPDRNVAVGSRFNVTVPADAGPAYPYFHRASIAEARYTVDDATLRTRPAAEPPLVATAELDVDGARVHLRAPVTRLEPNLPNGFDTRLVGVLPAVAVNLTPAQAIVPLSEAKTSLTVRVDLVNNDPRGVTGALRLALPAGWTAQPAEQPFAFGRAGERSAYTFAIAIPSLENRQYRIDAVAAAGGREYRTGYATIAHRDLETRYLPRESSVTVRGVDVRVAPNLTVGYVMGIGDDVPAGIEQLGAHVRLLDAQALATADLRQFDAIVTGTRAYAVREDLRTYNRRLLDYARNGGNLIVLYNTPEMVPAQYAPFAGTLPLDAEEVSEEDSPVDILAPNDPVLSGPNSITKADFDGWVEQRGSKFWATWDAAYTPIIATWDKGQAPQRGGWLHARVGSGHYTYFAYALHRQLPYSVPGAYRILANLLSLGKTVDTTR